MVNIDVSKGFKSFKSTKKVDGSKDFMISDVVLNLVAEAMVEFRERILKPNSLKPPRN